MVAPGWICSMLHGLRRMNMDPKEQNKTSLLYFGIGSAPASQRHTHPFYQLELCLSGSLPCHSQERDFLLSPGQIWLIPPEFPHEFSESRTPYEYLSLKFNYTGSVSSFHGCSPVIGYYMELIQALLRNNCPFSPHSQEGKRILENHLDGLMAHLSSKESHIPEETPFMDTCRELVCQWGYRVNVAFLAEYFHYTRSQLQYRFAKEHHASGNIKYFIEEILLDLAKKHLQYSGKSISEIARIMNFPSLYAFSRFFKRKTGLSPLHAKAGIRSPERQKK